MHSVCVEGVLHCGQWPLTMHSVCGGSITLWTVTIDNAQCVWREYYTMDSDHWQCTVCVEGVLHCGQWPLTMHSVCGGSITLWTVTIDNAQCVWREYYTVDSDHWQCTVCVEGVLHCGQWPLTMHSVCGGSITLWTVTIDNAQCVWREYYTVDSDHWQCTVCVEGVLHCGQWPLTMHSVCRGSITLWTVTIDNAQCVWREYYTMDSDHWQCTVCVEGVLHRGQWPLTMHSVCGGSITLWTVTIDNAQCVWREYYTVDSDHWQCTVCVEGVLHYGQWPLTMHSVCGGSITPWTVTIDNAQCVWREYYTVDSDHWQCTVCVEEGVLHHGQWPLTMHSVCRGSITPWTVNHWQCTVCVEGVLHRGQWPLTMHSVCGGSITLWTVTIDNAQCVWREYYTVDSDHWQCTVCVEGVLHCGQWPLTMHSVCGGSITPWTVTIDNAQCVWREYYTVDSDHWQCTVCLEGVLHRGQWPLTMHSVCGGSITPWTVTIENAQCVWREYYTMDSDHWQCTVCVEGVLHHGQWPLTMHSVCGGSITLWTVTIDNAQCVWREYYTVDSDHWQCTVCVEGVLHCGQWPLTMHSVCGGSITLWTVTIDNAQCVWREYYTVDSDHWQCTVCVEGVLHRGQWPLTMHSVCGGSITPWTVTIDNAQCVWREYYTVDSEHWQCTVCVEGVLHCGQWPLTMHSVCGGSITLWTVTIDNAQCVWREYYTVDSDHWQCTVCVEGVLHCGQWPLTMHSVCGGSITPWTVTIDNAQCVWREYYTVDSDHWQCTVCLEGVLHRGQWPLTMHSVCGGSITRWTVTIDNALCV